MGLSELLIGYYGINFGQHLGEPNESDLEEKRLSTGISLSIWN